MQQVASRQLDPARYSDWAGLLRRSAARVIMRVRAVGNTTLTIDDVVQEMSIAWCRARDLYDPSLGVPFGAYLQRGVMLHVRRWIESEISNRSYSHMSLEGEREDQSSLADRLEDTNVETPDAMIQQNQRRDYIMSKLSPRAALFVRLLEEPPVELHQIVMARRAQAARAKSMGSPRPTAPRVTTALIFEFMGADTRERSAIMKELKALTETRRIYR